MSTGMPTVDTTKKPAPQSWHPADIKAAIEKRGWSLRRLGTANGYAGKSLDKVLRHPWPKAERIVAEALGIPPQRIWPQRYHRDGSPKSGRGERGLGRYKAKRSTAAAARNVDVKGSR